MRRNLIAAEPSRSSLRGRSKTKLLCTPLKDNLLVGFLHRKGVEIDGNHHEENRPLGPLPTLILRREATNRRTDSWSKKGCQYKRACRNRPVNR